MSQITFATNGTTVMTTTKSYDYVNRLTAIETLNSQPSTLNSFRYGYNAASQRTSVTNADGSRWVYTYDSMGQVTSGKKYWADGAPVAGQQFTYGFDDIGNRQTTAAGGDSAGGNLRSATYGANLLNQYTNRTVPSYVNMLGEATNTATVSVWTQDGWFAATRQGAYFRAEISANNSSAPVWLSITNLAALTNGSNPDIVTNVTGKVLLAKSPEAFTYDADGNLTSDSLWTNVWNGENRRALIESGTGVPPVARTREQWTHLPDGRWIERIVSTNNGTAYYPAYTNRYVWDGQVLLAVLDHTNGLVMSFMRGLDLSSSVQGAGGSGGVLAVSFKTNGAHFVAYDGNANVTAFITASDGSESARYQYGPFGEPLRLTGPLAKLNPIRFSSQYADDVTGDLKYLFRDYDAATGRWKSRDPIAERGGNNLFVVAGNDLANRVDPLGLLVEVTQDDTGFNIRIGDWTRHIGPEGGTVTYNGPSTDIENYVLGGFVGHYRVTGKQVVDVRLLSIPAKQCKVSWRPVTVKGPRMSVDWWPPPPTVSISGSVQEGDAMEYSITLKGTPYIVYSVIEMGTTVTSKARVWLPCYCLCLETETKADVYVQFTANNAGLIALAYAGYVAAEAVIVNAGKIVLRPGPCWRPSPIPAPG